MPGGVRACVNVTRNPRHKGEIDGAGREARSKNGLGDWGPNRAAAGAGFRAGGIHAGLLP